MSETLTDRIRRHAAPGVARLLHEMRAGGCASPADVEQVIAEALPLDTRPVADGALRAHAVGLRCLVATFHIPALPLELVERTIGDLLREAVTPV